MRLYRFMALFAVGFVLLCACNPNAERDAKIRKECGKDLVFDFSRFGYFADDDCWKITCLEMSEKIYREKIVCLKEAK